MSINTPQTFEPHRRLLLELQKIGEININGFKQMSEALDEEGADRLIAKLLELGVNTENLANTFGKVFDQAVYPRDIKPSAVAPEQPLPLTPTIIEQGPGWIFCSNGCLYLVNPLETATYRAVTTRFAAHLKTVGVIARATYLAAAGECPAGADEGQAQAGKSAAMKQLERLLDRAVRSDASDIHMEPLQNEVRIRFRVDDTLKEVARYRYDEYLSIANSLMSKCNGVTAGSYNEAKDAMFVHEVPPQRKVKMRVMMVPVTLPGMQHEAPCFAIRLLNNQLEQRKLVDLGIPNTKANPQLTTLRLLCERKNGLILISGPTGSGKTTTLTAVLSEMLRLHPGRCRYTVEDPVEMNLQGVNHVQGNEAAGVTFERAVKSFLRGDPDEILVGEIRDLPVASQALTASITGHLVFSTIHTNSSIEAISRMIDLGCDHYIVASALKAVSAQRLVRAVCKHCSRLVRWGDLINGTHPELNEPDNSLIKLRYQNAPRRYGDLVDYPADPDCEVRLAGPGCSHCGNEGFKGRFLVTELFDITPPVQDLIAHRESAMRLRAQARKDGFREMWEHGATELFVKKQTTFDELIRALGEREASAAMVAQQPET